MSGGIGNDAALTARIREAENARRQELKREEAALGRILKRVWTEAYSVCLYEKRPSFPLGWAGCRTGYTVTVILGPRTDMPPTRTFQTLDRIEAAAVFEMEWRLLAAERAARRASKGAQLS